MRSLMLAIRGLVGTPGFAAAGVLSLAFAIAANTIVFGILQALILRPLPIERPEHVFFVQRGADGFGTHAFPFYRELRGRATLVSGLAAYRISPMALQTDAGSQRVWGYLATGNYFDVLGVRPAVGRFFHADDDRTPGDAPYAVLSHASWRTRFGGDPAIVGKTVRIKGRSFAILGVAPEGFKGTELFFAPELWVPMMMQPHIEERGWLENWGTWNTFVVARIDPGATPAQAQANLNAISVAVSKERAIDPAPRLTLVEPGLFGDLLRTPLQSFSFAVMLLALLVLLAACVNIAALFGIRSLDRMREIGIKLALGASRGRVARERLAEVFALSLAGGALGLVLAHTALAYLTQWRLAVDVPIRFDVHADWRVVLFSVSAAIFTGILSATGPLWRVWHADPTVSLRPSSSTPRLMRRKGWRAFPVRDLVLGVQIACCCILITGGVVSLRGLAGAFTTDLAMSVDEVTVVGFDLSLAGYRGETGRELQRRLLDAAAAIPGVTSAAYGNSVPLYIDYSSTSIFPDEVVDPSATDASQAAYYQVSPRYFGTLGMRLVRGREFSWQDEAEAPPVAIVNETLARRLGTVGTVGWFLRRGCATCPRIEVVGIVEDGKYQTLTEAPKPAIFFPVLQSANLSTMLLVRSDQPQSVVAPALREAVHRVDGDLPLHSLGGLDDAVAFVFVPAWAATIALNAFSGLAVLLILTGIYGLAMHSVSRRSREISIRAAIGARPLQILTEVLGRTATVLAVGSAIGIAFGVAASRMLESVVFQASPSDPAVIVAAAGVMCTLGLAATWLPARRALAIDPVRGLRED